MISVKQSNLISDSKTLANEILTQDVDRFECGLSRTATRIIGFLVGSVVASGVAGLFAFDANKDGKKIKIIQTRMDQLNLIEPSTEKETKAVAFQKQICENVKNYTKNARMIKLVTAISSLACVLCYFGYVVRYIDSPTIPDISKKPLVAMTGFAITGGLIASFVHWLFSGSDLSDRKIALALQAQTDLAETN